MYRIRFHGRGGQGMKTASRILGSSFFLAGYEVQDAPRYGAERRGAPIFAYVRAARERINERGVINHPDLVVVADDSLMGIAAAGVLQGVDATTTLLINSHDDEAVWRQRLNLDARILTLPAEADVTDRAALPYVGSRCAAAAAALVGVIDRDTLAQAITTELSHLGDNIVQQNLDSALRAFDQMQVHRGSVAEGNGKSAASYSRPAWISLPLDNVALAAPAIHAGATSVQVRTGLWRTMRPVIDYDKCNHCWWVCSSYCPDGAIQVRAGDEPVIDYDHCKGCLVCMAVCPPHAIAAIPEHQAQQETTGETP